MRAAWIPAVAVAGLTIVGSACGGDGDVAVPTADALVDLAVTADDLGADWASSPESEPQVVSDDTRGDLATLDLCPEAPEDDQRRAAELEWQAASGAGWVGEAGSDVASAFTPALIEVLLADDPDAITDTFEMLQDGMTSCVPGEIFLPDGGDFTVDALDVSAVGDDRFGVRYRQTDQPDGTDRWDIRHVIVRDGAVLMWLSEIEIDSTADTVVDDAAFDAAVVAAAARLSGAAPDGTVPGLANPASVYCIEQGGEVDIVDEADGQVGYCELPDGRRIEEWELYRSQTTEP